MSPDRARFEAKSDTGPTGAAPDPADRTRSYEELFEELNGIVERFEVGAVDVDAIGELLERAQAIVGELARRIAASRLKVEAIVPELLAAAERLQHGVGGAVPGQDLAADEDDEPF